jgi:DNA-binding transcriptional LysR family regulator
MDKLASIEAFHRVVEKRGFAAAARSLRMSPAMVTKHIGDLERHLGVRLLHRSTRRVGLTEAGTRFYEETVVVLAHLSEAERAATANQVEPAGVLRIASPGAFGELYLAPALPEFMRCFPRLALEVSCDDRVVDLIDGRFDIALRIGRLPDSSLTVRKLAQVSILVCGAPTYLERKGMPASPDDLLHHDCLQYDYQWAGNGWELNTGDGGSSRTVRLGDTKHRSNNSAVLRHLAIAGHGLVQLPDFIVGADIEEGSLVPVLEHFRPEDRWLSAVFPQRRHLPGAARAFVDFCIQRFGGDPRRRGPA